MPSVQHGVPYFDLSLQHVSRPLLRRMRRWGDGAIFAERIDAIRAREPSAAFRSNFIVGYPGETEDDHDALLRFVEETRLDWCGFFSYSAEEGTYAFDLDGQVAPGLVADRLAELTELQDRITAERQDGRIGSTELRIWSKHPVWLDRFGRRRRLTGSFRCPTILRWVCFTRSRSSMPPVLISTADRHDRTGVNPESNGSARFVEMGVGRKLPHPLAVDTHPNSRAHDPPPESLVAEFRDGVVPGVHRLVRREVGAPG